MIYYHPTRANRILANLEDEELRRLSAYLEEVSLPLGTRIHAAQEPIKYLTFPLSGIVSLIMLLEDGNTGEIAVVGKEGVIGSSIYTGGQPPPYEAVVQAAATALRLPARQALDEFNQNGNLQSRFLGFSQVLLAQTAQTALCNRHHTVEQQLARWLLLSLDRLASADVLMTQGMIAEMLGVRREGVTLAAGKLQEQGLISYRRGQIRVLDRQGLEHIACECYEMINREYLAQGLMPGTAGPPN